MRIDSRGLKKTRDIEELALVNAALASGERDVIEAMCYDQLFVCADCAGWYTTLTRFRYQPPRPRDD